MLTKATLKLTFYAKLAWFKKHVQSYSTFRNNQLRRRYIKDSHILKLPSCLEYMCDMFFMDRGLRFKDKDSNDRMEVKYYDKKY